jgi:hypothetical protein
LITVLGTGPGGGSEVVAALAAGVARRGVGFLLLEGFVLGPTGADELADKLVELGVGDGVAVDDGAAVGDWVAVAVGDGDDVGDEDAVGAGDDVGARAAGAATTREVAHGSPTTQEVPCRAAAVDGFAPPGAEGATCASNVAVAEVGAPGEPRAGSVQVSALCVASGARPLRASSPALLVMLALLSSPDRSSTTVAPVAKGCGLRAVSV